MEDLVNKLIEISKTYIGKKFGDTDLDDSYFSVISGEEDGWDTDLHTCVLSSGRSDTWIKFYVDVDPMTDEILNIDTDCVDYSKDGTLFECINIKNIK